MSIRRLKLNETVWNIQVRYLQVNDTNLQREWRTLWTEWKTFSVRLSMVV